MTGSSIGAAVPVIVAGEELLLLADKAVYWPSRATLLVADPHFGKAAAFRFAGLFVPRGTTAAALSRLSLLVAATGAERIVFLGDFLHAREGRRSEMMAAIASWRHSHAVSMMLVRGNHDRRAGDPSPEVGIDVIDGPLVDGPFALAHHPVPVEGRYVLAGHIHPCVTVRGRGRGNRERLACFWFGKEAGVLPAFGEFTGCAAIVRAEGERVWVIASGEVIEVA